MKRKKKAKSRPATLAPINPDFIRYTKNLKKIKVPQAVVLKNNLGFIPAPLDLSHLKGKKLFAGREEFDLPASYDLRQLGRVTPVKDQNPAGTCWAFATYGSLESCLLPAETWDFSENHMKNLLSNAYPEGFDRYYDEGGNHFMSTAYLARWTGPVLAEQDPYDPFSGESPPGLTPCKHVQKVVFIPDRIDPLDNQNIKQAIMTYGAVFSGMFWDDGYYNPNNYAYYFNDFSFSNHAVCIVGWDDNFDAGKFNTPPPGDGAFIIKNSWGKSWGEGGYFYISYYDFNIGFYNALFNNAEPVDNYATVFQYDPLGWVASLGFQSTTGWFANFFMASHASTVKALSWYAGSPQSKYNLYIYLNPVANKPRSGKLIKKKAGLISDAGYCTISLASGVKIKAGQKFSVVVKLTTPDYIYPIPAELPLEDYSSKAQAQAGESFISPDGKTWTDATKVYENTNVCLKAFASLP